MAAKTTDWRPGPTVCRCCLSEGCYKDISTEYFWMGKREVYAEMLSETLNLTIAYSQSGGPNSNSRLICEPCISRLRDASDFKRQVQECEKSFMQYLDPVGVNELDSLPAEPLDTHVKVERVKEEKEASDNEFDDRVGFQDEDDDDDLDDEPLTKLASRMPKKESVDLLDLLDNAKAGEKRKSTSKTKAGTAKKAKTKKEAKPTTSKAKPEKKKKGEILMTIARQNAEIILKNTTAYPFKLPETELVCVYCCEKLSTAELFRNHMETEHQDFQLRLAFAHVPRSFLKVDITDLRCRLCEEEFESVDDVANHLFECHGETKLNLDYPMGLYPFKFHTDQFCCALCTLKFTGMRALNRHVRLHFLNYACDTCDSSFPTPHTLQRHVKFKHEMTNLHCKSCKEEFAFSEDLKEHWLKSKSCCYYLCRICGERFYSWSLKKSHLELVHGMPRKTYPCVECGTVFDKRDEYRVHFVTEHTDHHFQCEYCSKKFVSEPSLQRHMVTHTLDRHFSCGVCGKSFFRKSTLNLHMWIHSDVKQYECEICDLKFNQKIGWTRHLKLHHPEIKDYE